METSEKITEISKALVAIQDELKNIPCTKENPYFKSKYAPLDSTLDISKPILKKHGLAIIQTLSNVQDSVSITTMLVHTSGEYIRDTITLKPTKTDPQGFGSAITYGRRYSISSFLNISSDDDDDGNDSSDSSKKKSQPKLNEIDKVINDIAEIMKSGYFEDEKADYKKELSLLKNNKAKLEAFQKVLDRAKLVLEEKKAAEKELTDKVSEVFDGSQVVEQPDIF